jgi:hypothetical protein
MERSQTRAATWSIAFPLILSLAAVPSSSAQTRPTAKSAGSDSKSKWTAPRTAWGDPDLNGVYSNDDETGIPFERPAQFEGKRLEDITPAELTEINKQRNAQFNAGVAGEEFAGGLRPPTHLIFDSFERRNSRPWLIVDPPDGREPPLTAEAKERIRHPRRGVSSNVNSIGPFYSYEDLGLYDRCITRGIPNSMMPAGYGSTYEIIQGKESVAIRYEMIHETRIIPLGGQPHIGDSLRTYMGDARGHWEGDTLVVETTHFNGRNAADVAGYGSPDRGASTALRIVERFKKTGSQTVEWSVTLEDSKTWARPWTFAMNLTKDATQLPFEYACHEGNYGLENILSAARAEEQR